MEEQRVMHCEFINTRQPDLKIYFVGDIVFSFRAVCSDTSWEKLTNLPILSLGLGVSLPNFKVHLMTLNTVPQRRPIIGMPRTHLHTLLSFYPSNHLTVPIISVANSIRRYPRIRTSKQGSKVLKHQRHLEFQHNTSLWTRSLTSAGPYWWSSTKTSFHVYGHLERNSASHRQQGDSFTRFLYRRTTTLGT